MFHVSGLCSSLVVYWQCTLVVFLCLSLKMIPRCYSSSNQLPHSPLMHDYNAGQWAVLESTQSWETCHSLLLTLDKPLLSLFPHL